MGTRGTRVLYLGRKPISTDHQNNDINICTTTNTTNTKRHDGLKDKGIIISSRITDPTKLNYRQHYDTFINQTMTKQCIKPYPMTQIDNEQEMILQGEDTLLVY